MITRNLEQLIIPQISVPHRTTQERGHTTERPASVANSCQNHFSAVGHPATKNLEVLTLCRVPKCWDYVECQPHIHIRLIPVFIEYNVLQCGEN